MKSNDNIEQRFLEAIERIKKSKNTLDNDTMLKLYGYYKQATIGDCNIECPSFWQVKEQAKWNAWDNKRGKEKNYVMKQYIKLVDKILES